MAKVLFLCREFKEKRERREAMYVPWLACVPVDLDGCLFWHRVKKVFQV